jgi:hypothetical protein
VLEQELEHLVRLWLGEAIDPLGKTAVHKQSFPPSDGVRPDHGMNRLEALSDVFRRASVLPERGIGPLGDVDEALADVRGGETLEEGLVGRGEAVVSLVSASPEGVAADRRECPDLQRGVVGRNRLESDVGVLRFVSGLYPL